MGLRVGYARPERQLALLEVEVVTSFIRNKGDRIEELFVQNKDVRNDPCRYHCLDVQGGMTFQTGICLSSYDPLL